MNSVLKAAGYILAHTPDMVIHNGTTQTTERVVNPDSKYLKVLKDHIRTYDEVIKYPPNQAYIGNITPQQLKEYDMPWYDKEIPNASKYGKFGEIMPQEEFIGLMQICDVFDLVKLEKNFASLTKKLLSENKLISSDLIEKIKDGEELQEIKKFIEEEHAEPLYNKGEIVGCVKKPKKLAGTFSNKSRYVPVSPIPCRNPDTNIKTAQAIPANKAFARNTLSPFTYLYFPLILANRHKKYVLNNVIHQTVISYNLFYY